MNLHKPVCGPGRAWMQSTFCYLIGWGRFTSTPVYSSNGSLYSDSFWQTYLVRRRYFSPQIIAQNHAFKVKVIQTCLSIFCKHTSWKECKFTFLFLRRMHCTIGAVLCFVFSPRSNEGEGIQTPQNLAMAWRHLYGAKSCKRVHITHHRSSAHQWEMLDLRCPLIKVWGSHCPMRVSSAEQRDAGLKSMDVWRSHLTVGWHVA